MLVAKWLHRRLNNFYGPDPHKHKIRVRSFLTYVCGGRISVFRYWYLFMCTASNCSITWNPYGHHKIYIKKLPLRLLRICGFDQRRRLKLIFQDIMVFLPSLCFYFVFCLFHFIPSNINCLSAHLKWSAGFYSQSMSKVINSKTQALPLSVSALAKNLSNILRHPGHAENVWQCMCVISPRNIIISLFVAFCLTQNLSIISWLVIYCLYWEVELGLLKKILLYTRRLMQRPEVRQH